jgi:hypothetical protein
VVDVVDAFVVDVVDAFVVDVVDVVEAFVVDVVDVVEAFVVDVVDALVVDVVDVAGEQTFSHSDTEPFCWSEPSGPDHTTWYESVTFPVNEAGTVVLAVAVAVPVLGSDVGVNGVVGNDGVTTTPSIRAGDRGMPVSRFVTDHSTGARSAPVQEPPVPAADGAAHAPAGAAAASKADAATAAPLAIRIVRIAGSFRRDEMVTGARSLATM